MLLRSNHIPKMQLSKWLHKLSNDTTFLWSCSCHACSHAACILKRCRWVQTLPLFLGEIGWTLTANPHLACFQQIYRYQLLKAEAVSAKARRTTSVENAQIKQCSVISGHAWYIVFCWVSSAWSILFNWRQQLTLPDTVLKASSYFFICITSSHLQTSPFFQSSTFRCSREHKLNMFIAYDMTSYSDWTAAGQPWAACVLQTLFWRIPWSWWDPRPALQL